MGLKQRSAYRHRANRAKDGWALLALTAAVVTMAQPAAAWENPLEKRYLTAPLQVCDQGSFHVGGVSKITPYADSNSENSPQQIIIGQMYVQFQVPKERKRYPLIMIHGGGFAGSCLESTAEGTEGWFSYAVRKNLATFVVDQAGRGRSGFDSSILEEARRTNNASLIPARIRLTTNNEAWTTWFGPLVPTGSTIFNGRMVQHGDPRDPDCAADPDHCTYTPRHDFNAIDPKLRQGVGQIGPEPDPRNAKQLALDFYKFQAHPYMEDTLPSSECPTCVPTTVPPDGTWTGKALAELVAGLDGAIVATHSQSGAVGHHMVRYLKEMGKLGKLKGLITIEGSCSLEAAGLTPADFKNIPYLAVKGDYAAVSQPCADTVDAIRQQRSAKADYLKLDDPAFNGKFRGTTHMMMMGTNNLEVFDQILKWTNANIPNPMDVNYCTKGGH